MIESLSTQDCAPSRLLEVRKVPQQLSEMTLQRSTPGAETKDLVRDHKLHVLFHLNSCIDAGALSTLEITKEGPADRENGE